MIFIFCLQCDGAGSRSSLHGSQSFRSPFQPAGGVLAAPHPGAAGDGRRCRRVPQEDGVGRSGRGRGQRGGQRGDHHRPHPGSVHLRGVGHRHGGGDRRGDGRQHHVGDGQHHRHRALQHGPQEGGEDDPGLPGGDPGHQDVPGVRSGEEIILKQQNGNFSPENGGKTQLKSPLKTLKGPPENRKETSLSIHKQINLCSVRSLISKQEKKEIIKLEKF